MSAGNKVKSDSSVRRNAIEMPERSLWAAVFYRAIYDAAEPRKIPSDAELLAREDARRSRAQAKGKKTPKAYDGYQLRLVRERARAWLLMDQEDFPLICDYAGLDPDAARDAVYRMRDNGWPRVVMPGDNRTYEDD